MLGSGLVGLGNVLTAGEPRQGGSGAGGAPGIASFDSITSRAAQYIQDPLGMGAPWYDDFTNAASIGSAALVRTTLTDRRQRSGAGKFGATYAAGQGIMFQQEQAALASLVSNPRTDSWFMSAGGVITHMPGASEVYFVGLTSQAASGAAPIQAIASDNSVKYTALCRHPANANPDNYCVKVWDGTTPRYVDTLVPVIVGTYAVTELACDNMRTFFFLLNGEPVFDFSDSSLIDQIAANGFFLDRGASDESGLLGRIYDYVFVAGMRS